MNWTSLHPVRDQRQTPVWLALLSTLALVLSSCATTGKSAALGGVAGAGVGAGIGAIADPGAHGKYRTRNVLIGGLVGAGAGIAAGVLAHSALESSKEEGVKEGEAQGRKEVPDPNEPPKLIPAQWHAEMIEAKRIGNRFIPRHIEYIITDVARWEDVP